MSLLETTTSRPLTDREIAFSMLESAKVYSTLLCAATLEAYSPPMRALFENQLTKHLQEHKVVFDYLHKHGWYDPHKSPMDMAMSDLKEARKVLD